MRANHIDLARVFWQAFKTAQQREADGDVGYVQYFLDTQRGPECLAALIQEAEIHLNIDKADAAIKRVLEGVQ